MATNVSETTGIMFTNLPTVDDACDYYRRGLSMVFDRWTVVAYDPRTVRYFDDDAEAMDETNFAALVDALGLEMKDIPRDDINRVGGWSPAAERGYRMARLDFIREARKVGAALVSVGIRGTHTTSARVLIVDTRRADRTDRLDIAQDLVSSLSDYPLLDEQGYSEREWEAWESYAPTAVRDEIRYACRGVELAEPIEEIIDALADRADDIAWIVRNGMNYSNGFTGEYAPDMLPILTRFLSAGGGWEEREGEEARDALGLTDPAACAAVIHALETIGA